MIGSTRQNRTSLMLITKSKFVAGVQCLKRLYLMVHQPQLAAEPDESAQAIIDQGHEVGLLAQQMFSGGVTVESRDREQAIRTTKELIANPWIPAIFEGAFEHGNVFVRVDLLQRRPNRRWRLIEVKSAADLKDYYVPDVAIQHRTVAGSGLDLGSSSLAHVNREYIYQGGAINAQQFFRLRNLTSQVEDKQPEIATELRTQFRVLAKPEPPDVAAGAQCTDPITCEFFDRCNPPLPDDHISRLPRIGSKTLEKLAAAGIQSIHDIPDDYPLTERLRRACTCVQSGRPWFSDELADELKSLRYPLYFMDFETVNPAIPRFAGMRPYDQIPFQWSLHIQRETSAKPQHYEFLAMDDGDPRPAFTSSLCDALGKKGSIVVYSQQFESQRLADLGRWLPEFADRIEDIQARLWDLLPVVRSHVYHPAFGGSFSLKAVLPALAPAMTYEGMEVADGQAAGLAWQSLVSGGLSEAERQQKRKALLDYCGQDTMALVRLLEVLLRLGSR
jgi:predicted RecB family nuclease